MKTKNSLYLVLTIIFVILSVIGGYFLYQVLTSNKTGSSSKITIDEPTPIPTETPILTPAPIATTSSTASSSSKTKTPTPTPIKKTPSPTSTPKPTLTPKPTSIPTSIPTVTPTPVSTTYKSTEDGFSVEYLSSRKLYQDTESSGRRYTFYSPSGNFAVHVGLDGKWAWTNPDRDFTSDFTVAGQDTFYYEISTQTIVDFQYNYKNYTLQCVHNGKESLKTECDNFLKSFQLL